MTGRDILCLSSIDWDFIWQGHQEIMATLAAQGDRVLFVENTGVRAPTLRDLPRLRQRIRNWLRGTKGFRQERERLYIYSPLLLPFPYSRLACWINRRLLLGALQRWMRAAKFEQPIVWTFLPTPLVLEVIEALTPRLTIYYCIDDLASSSRQARRIGHSEARLFRTADLVFVTSHKLQERASRFARGPVHLFPFGVSFPQFERVRNSGDGLPTDLQSLRRPVIGYVGGIHQWVDQELLAAVAERMPEASFALVGPPQADVSALARCRNIHLLGRKPHADIPHYIKGFDVGIVPYRLSDYTAHVYPTKLNEYLAMGIPVVATDLPEIRRFNDAHQGVVSIAQDAEHFAQAVREVMGGAVIHVQRLIDVARQNSWDTRIAQMSALIEQELAARHATGWRWQETLRRLYRSARRRVLRTVLAVAAVYVALFHSPAVWWVAAPLRMTAAPRSVDAIVVLAGGVGESGQAGGGYQERVKHAVDLYQQGFAKHLVFSSGYRFVFQEARVMQELAINLGVPPEAILLETQAAHTQENVTLVSAILERQGWRSILLVSSPYHMRRAVLTWRKLAPAVEVVPSPVAQSQFYVHNVGANLEQIQGIAHEYAGLLYYWWKRWL